MSDSNTNAGPAAGGTPRRGYALPDQAAPLPRQWQMQRQMGPLPTPGQGSVQHFRLNAEGAADWRPPPSARRMERAILVGLWLLVMLTAIVIGLA